LEAVAGTNRYKGCSADRVLLCMESGTLKGDTAWAMARRDLERRENS
jgi:hypothetical protein